MQFQKGQGNVSNQNDYLNMETKTADVQDAMGSKNGDELTTSTNNNAISSTIKSKRIEKEKNS